MLSVVQPFEGATAINGNLGNINHFIENVLIEVVTENYRQLMSEALIRNEGLEDAIQLDPPLRANERILSGLFSNAISRVAPRSRPEARIDRIERIDSDDSEDGDEVTSKDSAGRVDYLAWYGNRVVAVELKAGRVNVKKPVITARLQQRWDSVNNQAKTAQGALRARQKDDGHAYPSPISLALMVVVAQSKVSLDEAVERDGQLNDLRENMVKTIKSFEQSPQFIATYTFPLEFRRFSLRARGVAQRGQDKCAYIPFVSFLGRVAVNRI
ncbi:MAG: hypothetical protein ACOH1V_07005 [Stenotrophomonas sp.]